MKLSLTLALLGTLTFASQESMASSVITPGSVKERTAMWNQKVEDAKKAEKTPDKQPVVITGTLGDITRDCENTIRAKHYGQIKNDCEAARKENKFDDFYKKYEKASGKLEGLRDLGTYHPDTELSKQKALTKHNMHTTGTPIGKLDKSAMCEKFAEHMSIVHPANNGPFEETMKCVADKRGFQER